MNLSELTLDQVRELRAEKRDDVVVRMYGRDIADYYVIIEDSREYDTQGYSVSHFMLFLIDDPDRAAEHTAHTTMVQAMIQYAERFVLDNCDSPDATDDLVCALHDKYRAGLSQLLE